MLVTLQAANGIDYMTLGWPSSSKALENRTMFVRRHMWHVLMMPYHHLAQDALTVLFHIVVRQLYRLSRLHYIRHLIRNLRCASNFNLFVLSLMQRLR